MSTTATRYTVRCPFCGTDYQSRRTAKALAKMTHSCSSSACLAAAADQHNANVAAYQAELAAGAAARRAARAAAPDVRMVPATDWNYLVAFSGKAAR